MYKTFEKIEPAFYIQDFEGNIIQELPSNHLASQVMDFSNEVYSEQNTSALDYSMFWWGQDRLDSLYHYDEATNRMVPKFSTNLNSIDNMHNYIELPNYYLVSRFQPNPPKSMLAMIDKQTLKGSYVRLILDMMGDIDVTNTGFVDGNFILNIPPFYLQKQWMNWQDLSNLPAGVAKFIKYIQTEDAEDMNNVVLIGKLKQSKDEGFTLKDMQSVAETKKDKKVLSNVLETDTTVYTINDIDAFPEFYDSDKQIWQYVSDKVKYTESIGSDVKGQMVLSFIVNTDGSLSNLKLRRGLSPALDEQVLQIVKDLPKLRPAKKNGNPVRCELIIAVYLSNE